MMRFFLFPLLAGILSTFSHADERTEGAVAAAKEWLALLDKEEYKSSWEEAAPFFKEMVKEEQWEKIIAAVREPVGVVKSRTLISAELTKSLPGAPDGEYVVIQFNTRFAGKQDTVETVTPMMHKGVWKVSGYFMK